MQFSAEKKQLFGTILAAQNVPKERLNLLFGIQVQKSAYYINISLENQMALYQAILDL